MRKARTSFCLEYRIPACNVQRRSAFPNPVLLAALG